MTTKFNVLHMSHILDDFMFFAKSRALCANYQGKFAFLCRDLNLPLKASKTVSPTTQAELHGVSVDTLSPTVSLPEDKYVRAKGMLHQLSSRKTVTLMTYNPV